MGDGTAAGTQGREQAQRRAGLRALAVDDEAPALEELLYLLRGDARVGHAEGARGATEALRRLGRAVGEGQGADAGIDVVFLDINMPGLTGLDMAHLLAGFAAPPLIVFVTAHEDHAVRAFDLKAVDYLLKPIRRERFSEAVRRVTETLAAAAGPHAAHARPGTPATAPERTGALPARTPAVEVAHIPVELGGVTRFVDIDDITHVEAQGDYARVHTRQGGGHLIRNSLTALEESWRPRGFVRIHRRYLVRLSSIEELRLDGGGLSVRIGDRILAVSRRNARELRDLLVRRANAAPRRGR
ncbi:LytTR family DNA-binding domain-containing protein [Streptomyces sp. NPDC049915]|uniref:LytR/AlgR family response regulator transcription factor n=1 Tax=Streptomyces sp. NPDC049915 TaxID=3155510 RepID=UPI00343FF5B1